MARDTAYEWRDRTRERAAGSSWFLPLVGAGIGALVGRALLTRAQERGWDRSDRRYDLAGYGYDRPGGWVEGTGIQHGRFDQPYWHEQGAYAQGPAYEHASGDASQGAGDRVAEVKERVGAKAEEVKGRLGETAAAMRERLPDRDRIVASTHDDVGVWALGAMALGALFGVAVPMSRRERELLEPARRKVREAAQQAKDVAVEKGHEAMDLAVDKARGGESESREEEGSSSSTGMSGPAPIQPIH